MQADQSEIEIVIATDISITAKEIDSHDDCDTISRIMITLDIFSYLVTVNSEHIVGRYLGGW
jgi:hypothetical protein